MASSESILLHVAELPPSSVAVLYQVRTLRAPARIPCSPQTAPFSHAARAASSHDAPHIQHALCCLLLLPFRALPGDPIHAFH